MRRRVRLAVAAVVVVVVGLVVSQSDGLVADLLGGALYAALVYVLIAVVLPRARRPVVAAVALAVCVVVELAQLTAGPAALADAFPPAALVLGTTFNPWDLLAYAVGVAAALGADR